MITKWIIFALVIVAIFTVFITAAVYSNNQIIKECMDSGYKRWECISMMQNGQNRMRSHHD